MIKVLAKKPRRSWTVCRLRCLLFKVLHGVVDFVVGELFELVGQLCTDCFRIHVNLLLIGLSPGLGVGVIVRLKVGDGILCGCGLKLILSLPDWSAVSRFPAHSCTSSWNTT